MIRIETKNLSKTFEINHQQNESFLGRFIKLNKNKKEVQQVLKNINLKVNSGEFIGIIGKNGSGKSTLLRLISGIYKYYTGEIFTNGKIISLINITAGIKYRLTMRENIYLIGSLFGMSNSEIKNKFNQIVEFSELEKFVDTKIYKFSTGMIHRLAFSISINADPEILILDEIFEVGDIKFREKSKKIIREKINGGCSVLLVTHDTDMIENEASRIILMEKGRIQMDGNPNDVLKTYF